MSVAYFQLVKQSNNIYMYMSVCRKRERERKGGKRKEGGREKNM